MGGINCLLVFMNGNPKIMALGFVLFVALNLARSDRSHIYLENRSVAQGDVMLGYRLVIAWVRRLIIINGLKGFADIVASLKWFLLYLPIDLIVIADVWQWILGTDIRQRITGIGKVVLQRNKAVITYMMAIRNGGNRYFRGTVTLAESAGQMEVAYWLPTISRNGRIILNYCLI